MGSLAALLVALLQVLLVTLLALMLMGRVLMDKGLFFFKI